MYHDIGRHVYTKHGSRHNWRSDDLLKLARREKRKIIVSAETGLDDLTEAKYPWFNETCESNPLSSVHYCLLSVDDQPSDVKSSDAGFFSVVRDPYEWVLSAENHMRQTHHGGFYSNYGYFDLGNIQSRMTGYGSSGISLATVCSCSHACAQHGPSYQQTSFCCRWTKADSSRSSLYLSWMYVRSSAV